MITNAGEVMVENNRSQQTMQLRTTHVGYQQQLIGVFDDFFFPHPHLRLDRWIWYCAPVRGGTVPKPGLTWIVSTRLANGLWIE